MAEQLTHTHTNAQQQHAWHNKYVVHKYASVASHGPTSQQRNAKGTDLDRAARGETHPQALCNKIHGVSQHDSDLWPVTQALCVRVSVCVCACVHACVRGTARMKATAADILCLSQSVSCVSTAFCQNLKWRRGNIVRFQELDLLFPFFLYLLMISCCSCVI